MTAETNKNESIPSPLGMDELKALEMKFEGHNLKEIAEQLGWNYAVTRQWFGRGGKLYDFYMGYAEEEIKKRRAQAHHTFKAHINNAVRTLVQVMNKSKLDTARVQAAKEILNRELGEPLKIVATDDGRVNEILEALRKDDEEEKLNIYDETIPTNVGSGEGEATTESKG